MATQRFTASNDNASSNDNVAIDIPGDELLHQAASELVSSRQLARPLFWVGSCTLVTVFNRIIYSLPPGAIFEGHQVAYYLTLFAIFLAGVAEVYAAILLSSGQDGGHGRACARPLLCAAAVLLAFLVAFGGTPVLVMG